MADRWKESQIGPLGKPLAEAIAPAIEAWLEECCEPGDDPEDFALIAREVVRTIANEKRLYHARNAAYCKRKESRRG